MCGDGLIDVDVDIKATCGEGLIDVDIKTTYGEGFIRGKNQHHQ